MSPCVCVCTVPVSMDTNFISTWTLLKYSKYWMSFCFRYKRFNNGCRWYDRGQVCCGCRIQLEERQNARNPRRIYAFASELRTKRYYFKFGQWNDRNRNDIGHGPSFNFPKIKILFLLLLLFLSESVSRRLAYRLVFFYSIVITCADFVVAFFSLHFFFVKWNISVEQKNSNNTNTCAY